MGERKPILPIARATAADGPAMQRTLGLAFADDPALSFIIPDRAERLRRFPAFFANPVRDDLAHGFALHSPASEVVTLWRTPGRAAPGLWETVQSGPGYLRALGPCLPRALKVSSAISSHFPRDGRFLYLHYAAVAPDHQGRGLAGAAIRAGQGWARENGVPVYLETATQTNVAIYMRLGFAITCEYDVPVGGPHFWGMIWKA